MFRKLELSFPKWKCEETLTEVGTVKETGSITGLTLAISIVKNYRQNTVDIG